MDGEHRALLIKTLELIETTRGEISRLREEIELTRITVNRSHDLLSHTGALPRTSGRFIGQ